LFEGSAWQSTCDSFGDLHAWNLDIVTHRILYLFEHGQARCSFCEKEIQTFNCNRFSVGRMWQWSDAKSTKMSRKCYVADRRKKRKREKKRRKKKKNHRGGRGRFYIRVLCINSFNSQRKRERGRELASRAAISPMYARVLYFFKNFSRRKIAMLRQARASSHVPRAKANSPLSPFPPPTGLESLLLIMDKVR